MHTSYPVLGKPSLRGKLQPLRLEEILSWEYSKRMRYLRILRFLLPVTDRTI